MRNVDLSSFQETRVVGARGRRGGQHYDLYVTKSGTVRISDHAWDRLKLEDNGITFGQNKDKVVLFKVVPEDKAKIFKTREKKDGTQMEKGRKTASPALLEMILEEFPGATVEAAPSERRFAFEEVGQVDGVAMLALRPWTPEDSQNAGLSDSSDEGDDDDDSTPTETLTDAPATPSDVPAEAVVDAGAAENTAAEADEDDPFAV